MVYLLFVFLVGCFIMIFMKLIPIKKLVVIALVLLFTTSVFYWHIGGDIAPTLVKVENPLQGIQNELEKSPEDAGLWQALGKAYLLNNAYLEAIFSYSQALKYGQPSGHIYASVAVAYYSLNDYRVNQEVEALLDKALQLNPQEPTALLLRANISLSENDFEVAYKIWLELLEQGARDIDRRQLIENIEKIMPLLKARQIGENS